MNSSSVDDSEEASADSPNYRLDVAASRVAIRTEATGLLARLAHDLELVAEGFTADLEVAGDSWSATLRFPIKGIRVEGVVRSGRVVRSVLSEKDCAEIIERIETKALKGTDTITVRLRGPSREQGEATVAVRTGQQTVALQPKALEASAGTVEVSGTCQLSLKALRVPEIKGPLGAFKVHDGVEIIYEVVLRADR